MISVDIAANMHRAIRCLQCTGFESDDDPIGNTATIKTTLPISTFFYRLSNVRPSRFGENLANCLSYKVK